MSEKILYEENPSMKGSNPVGFYLSVLLILAFGLGLVILFLWYIKTKLEKVTITNQIIKKEEGWLSKKMNEINLKDVKNIKTEQSYLQKKYDSGKLLISSAGTGGVEMKLSGYENISNIKKYIQSSA